MSLRNVAYWVAVAAAITVYLVMVLATLPGISAAAGGMVPFDMRPGGYTPEDARAFLAALTEEGRALYLGPQHRLDLIYPALLAVVLAGAIWRLWGPGLLRWGLLVAVVLGMGADWLENARVAALLRATDVVTAEAVAAASRATLVKSVATSVAMTGVLAGLGRAAWRRWLR